MHFPLPNIIRKYFMKKLPDCDQLFERYLSPWYPENEKPSITRPDMYIIAGYENETLEVDNIQYLTDSVLIKTKETFRTMRESYKKDFQNFIVFERLDLDVIDAIDKSFGKREVNELIEISDALDFGNDYLVLICEFGLALGDLFVETGRFRWLYSYPYFHSIVVNPETGYAVTVFDWAVKKFSSYGINDGIRQKFLATMEYVERDIEKNIG